MEICILHSFSLFFYNSQRSLISKNFSHFSWNSKIVLKFYPELSQVISFNSPKFSAIFFSNFPRFIKSTLYFSKIIPIFLLIFLSHFSHQFPSLIPVQVPPIPTMGVTNVLSGVPGILRQFLPPETMGQISAFVRQTIQVFYGKKISKIPENFKFLKNFFNLF